MNLKWILLQGFLMNVNHHRSCINFLIHRQICAFQMLEMTFMFARYNLREREREKNEMIESNYSFPASEAAVGVVYALICEVLLHLLIRPEIAR